MNITERLKAVPPRTWEILATIFVFTIAIGGFFLPWLGLALAILMATAVVMTLRKPRSFCSGVCPRGRALGFIMRNASRRRPLPSFLLGTGVRRMFCGFMMFCVVGNLVRIGGGLRGAGTVFWSLCAISLSIGLVMGWFYKPRAWCAVCPLGTLQDTISRRPAK